MMPLPRRAHGQALVEFTVVALFFLVPMFLALVVLGKLADVRHTTAMAARYAAWERTVWYDGSGEFGAINGPNQKSSAQIGNEIAVRLINDRSSGTTVIRHADRNATGLANGIDPLWHDNAHRAFLDSGDQLDQTLAWQTPRRRIDGGALDAFTPLPNDSLAVARVSLRHVAAGSEAYRRLWPQGEVWSGNWAGFDFAAGGAILSNTWAANGSGATAAMVRHAVPTAQGLGIAVGAAVNVARTAWDPLAPPVELGKVAPDVVPKDRLK